MVLTEEGLKKLQFRLHEMRDYSDYSQGIPSGVLIFSKQWQEYMLVTLSDHEYTEFAMVKRSPDWRVSRYSTTKIPTKIIVGDDYKGNNRFFICNFMFDNGKPMFTDISKVILDHLGVEALGAIAMLHNVFIPNKSADIRECVGVVEVTKKEIASINRKKTESRLDITYVETIKRRFRKDSHRFVVKPIMDFFEEYTLVSHGVIGFGNNDLNKSQ